MRKTFLTLALAAAAFAAGCAEADKPVANANKAPANAPANASKPSEPAIPYPDVERISLADEKKDFDAGNAIFVDTRPGVSYQEEHVKGAINIGGPEELAKADTLPKGKKIIAYCS